jgi:hypothetical protein
MRNLRDAPNMSDRNSNDQRSPGLSASGNGFHLLTYLGIVRRGFTPDGFWIDTNELAGPALRDVVIPHRLKRCVLPLARRR